jgi:hypothetical protein
MNYKVRDTSQLDRIEEHLAAISFVPRMRLSLIKLIVISIFCITAGLYLAIGIGVLHDHFFPPASPPESIEQAAPSPAAASQPHHRHHAAERTR